MLPNRTPRSTSTEPEPSAKKPCTNPSMPTTPIKQHNESWTSIEPLPPSKVTEPASKISMSAMVMSLSPMQKKHFVGELMDEERSIGLVGFDASQHSKLQALQALKVPVHMANCDIQHNRYSQALEVVVKGNTLISQSSKQFDIDDPNTVGSTAITLNRLEEMTEYDKVNVNVKVIDVAPAQIVGRGIVKQNVVIGDTTGTANLTLWGSDINRLAVSKSYSIKRLLVRVFNSTYYLSLPSSGATIEDIGDINIPGVNDTTADSISLTNMSILKLNVYKMCMKCTNKVECLDDDDTLGRCQGCNMIQLHTKCNENIMTELVVSDASMTFHTVLACNDIVKAITQDKEVTHKSLLTAKPFNMTCNQHCMITSVSRTD